MDLLGLVGRRRAKTNKGLGLDNIGLDIGRGPHSDLAEWPLVNRLSWGWKEVAQAHSISRMETIYKVAKLTKLQLTDRGD